MMNFYACMYYSTDYHCITMMFFSHLLVPTMVHGSQEGCLTPTGLARGQVGCAIPLDTPAGRCNTRMCIIIGN